MSSSPRNDRFYESLRLLSHHLNTVDEFLHRVMRCDIPGDPVDVAIAMEHLALAAAAEGLGTCWIGAFYQAQIREVLGIPESAKVVGVMTLGYQADSPQPKSRKPISEIVSYDRWQ